MTYLSRVLSHESWRQQQGFDAGACLNQLHTQADPCINMIRDSFFHKHTTLEWPLRLTRSAFNYAVAAVQVYSLPDENYFSGEKKSLPDTCYLSRSAAKSCVICTSHRARTSGRILYSLRCRLHWNWYLLEVQLAMLRFVRAKPREKSQRAKTDNTVQHWSWIWSAAYVKDMRCVVNRTQGCSAGEEQWAR